MRIDVHVNLVDGGVERKLDFLTNLVKKLLEEGKKMAADLEALKAEVARNTEVDESAIVLIQGIAAQLEELKGDPAAIQALADRLKASSDALAAAVVANTAPPPTPA